MGKTSARSDGMTRAESKFEKKRQFYESVRTSVVKKAISKENEKRRRRRQKKMKAYDLSSLYECLPEVKAPPKSVETDFKLNCKRRKNLVLKESNQFKTVVSHQAFQSDPLGAIHQHLQSTQPAVDDKPKRKNSKTRKKAKKKKSKDSVSMES